MEFLREVIESVILTAKVKNVDPVSLLLIAPPESGKTSVVLERPCKSVEAYSDITGKGIHFVIATNHDISHIIINDLVACLSHKAAVNRYTTSVLNALTEEGITQIATPAGIQTFSGTSGKKGIIASLTLDLVRDSRHWWNRIGFTSRMIPFCYSYPDDLIVSIKEAITESKGANIKKHGSEFLVPKEPLEIEYDNTLRRNVQMLSEFRSRLLSDPSGLRRLRQYHALVQAHAILQGRENVLVDDVEFLNKIDAYVSYTEAKPLWSNSNGASAGT